MDTRDMLADVDLSLALFDQLREVVYVTDLERRIIFWNAAAERVTGYLRQDVTGRRCHEDLLMHCDAQGQCLCGSACPLSSILVDGKPREMTAFLRHRHGHRVAVRLRARPIHANGAVAGVVELFEEAPAIVRDEMRELEALGCLDPGTGALTRAGGELRLRQQLLEIDTFGGAAGWLRIALRDPDQLSHRLGHAAPAAAMGLAARTLRGALSASDSLSLWGDHEFRVLISRCDAERLAESADLLRLMVRHSEFEWWGEPVRVDVRVSGTLATIGDSLATIERRLQHE